jgi:hypothetical protein
MSARSYFPFFNWTIRQLTGCWARRIYIAIILIVLCMTSAARLRTYVMARRIQSVLHGLAEIRVDQTTEQQLLKSVPYLTRSEHEWKAGEIVQRWYVTEISNESDWLMSGLMTYGSHLLGLLGQDPESLRRLAYQLGYRYLSFDASVLVQDGRVSQVTYGLAKEWVRPREIGYIVSAKSVHGFWLPHLMGFAVTSEEDVSPQYRPGGDEKGLGVIYTTDAPPERTTRAFQLNLSCFWSLRGCDDAREIAPAVWQDIQALQAATYQQLISGKCPDSIIEGRTRYLPDLTVLLLEVTGSRRIDVNEEGSKTEDWFTDYKLIDVIRGRSAGSWNSVRLRRTIPSPMDHARTIANQIWPLTKIGSQALFFGNIGFYSCRIIPASPSALAIVRKSTIPPKRPEDEIQIGLM